MSIVESFTAQKAFFSKGKTLSEGFRRKQLKKLKDSVLRHEEDIYEAVKTDLNKSKFECYETEIGMVLEEISYMLKNLHRFMKPQRVKTPLAHFPSSGKIYREPYGQVLIMAPWNYPFQLSMLPLAGAIASGNCAVIKPSDYASATAAVIKTVIEEIFPEEYVYTVQGGREVNQELLDMPFDYIFFTGGVETGRYVMEKAAKHLTPITLELGGKSPCIVDETADISISARRIAWGKFLNAGQTCVAPDYLLIHESVKDDLIEKLKKSIEAFYGKTPHKNEVYPKIINEKHFDRLKRLMKSEDIIWGGEINSETMQIAPTLIDAVWDSEIMADEIFGPLLPVITFRNITEAAEEIRKRPKPLALYIFTSSKERQAYVVKNISYGGGCINDTVVHLASCSMPFGGVGASGMGNYHGNESFITFSHSKSVLEKKRWPDLPVRYPPNTERDMKLLKKLMK